MSNLRPLKHILFLLLLSNLSHADYLLWMTDGSPVEFSDTESLAPVMTPPSLLEPQPYEGALDYLPAIGDTELVADTRFFVSVEAEWVLIKPEGFSELVDENTEVVLQGMSDTKYFAAFLEHQDLWQPASIGNNVIAQGEGIKTTLGALARGEVNADVTLSYLDVRGRLHTFTSNSQSLATMPLIEFVNQVIRSHSEVITHINLGAIEAESAWVNLDAIRTVATLKALFSCAIRFSCSHQPLPEQVLKQISMLLVKGNAYMKDVARLEMIHSSGKIKGEATITIN